MPDFILYRTQTDVELNSGTVGVGRLLVNIVSNLLRYSISKLKNFRGILMDPIISSGDDSMINQKEVIIFPLKVGTGRACLPGLLA